MAKFKAGDKVRIIDVDKIGGADAYFMSGDTTHVISVAPGGYPYLYCNDGDYVDGLFVTDRECNYIELATDKPSKSERISLLESQVAELQAKVEALQKPKFDTSFQPFIKKDRSTPNQQRKAVIERAKAFVAKHLNIGDEVVIAENLRKVTVIVGAWTTFPVGLVRVGVSKCAPDDVFNADIGKAIALGRALGLDVSEFENAVKPTELVIGQTTRRGSVYAVRPKRRTYGPGAGEEFVAHDEGYTVLNGQFESWAFIEGATIIDDTEAQY